MEQKPASIFCSERRVVPCRVPMAGPARRRGVLAGALASAGMIVALPAAAQLSAAGNQFLHQGSAGILEAAEEDDAFGRRLASGDFDGNGVADLAVGIPDEAVGALAAAGVLQVLYGAPGGVSTTDQLWSQDSFAPSESAEEADLFGWALAVGNFDGDAYDDLAIAAPWEDLGSTTDVGVVHVLYGGPLGLALLGHQIWHQDSPGLLGSPEHGDVFGRALCAGDFDGDGFDDLAIGVPGEGIGGAVQVLYGGSGGLSTTDQLWSQDSPGLLDDSESLDLFGESVAAGDFDDDGYDDLAVGVVWEDVDGVSDAGAVQVLYGGPLGLGSAGNQFWHQNSPGMADSAEEDDNFGQVLEVADFDGDGFADLAVGIPYEDLAGVFAAGAVHVLYGGALGLSSAGDQLWSQQSAGPLDGPEQGDAFGSALSAGDFDADGFLDLAIGVPGEDDAGAVQILLGSSSGLTNSGSEAWSQDSPGMLDAAEPSDWFGGALSAADLDGDGVSDLAIGVPGEDVFAGSRVPVVGAGAVQILYSMRLFFDGFESGDTSAWSSTTP